MYVLNPDLYVLRRAGLRVHGVPHARELLEHQVRIWITFHDPSVYSACHSPPLSLASFLHERFDLCSDLLSLAFEGCFCFHPLMPRPLLLQMRQEVEEQPKHEKVLHVFHGSVSLLARFDLRLLKLSLIFMNRQAFASGS